MNLALFDFDGTITQNDTWTPFLRFSVSRRRTLLSTVVLGPLIVAYKLGWISARRGRPIVAIFAFWGRQTAEVRELGRRYAGDVLPTVVRQRALERIAWHKAQGDIIVIVSASLDAYLVPWCESMGVDVICTQLDERNGRLTGRYVRGECVGGDKVVRIRERYDLDRYPIIYAYGDTDEDREMLNIAHEKFYRREKVTDTTGLSSHHPREARTV